MATMARRPVGGSWKNTTSSNSSPSASKTDTDGKVTRSPGALPTDGLPGSRERGYHAAVIPCAYLRVYRPLDSFDERERADWERYILSGGYRAARPVYREESI